jgi:ATP-dependent protease HslVU (ClpYQ) ATPase subunit
MASKTKVNISTFKEVVHHMIKNNRFLQENGKTPKALEIVGDSGLGKTSAILQVAEEIGLPFVKINLAQIEELGD